jgi:hypothetical protein
MATVYYGDGSASGGLSGNWNNLANWYSTPSAYTGKGTIPGIPLGRVPNDSDTVVVLDDMSITTGPTSGSFGGNIIIGQRASLNTNTIWNGNISFAETNGYPDSPGLGTLKITAGTFNGNINTRFLRTIINNGTPFLIVYLLYITGGTFNGGITGNGLYITGGLFNGLITLGPTSGFGADESSASLASEYRMSITYAHATTAKSINNWFKGGTYSPASTASFQWNGSRWTISGVTPDVGFAAGGGTFSPRITVPPLNGLG